MKIGVMGVGTIGSVLAPRLSEAGHHVQVANSRGPETIPADVLVSGARAVLAADVVRDVDVLILSIPLNRLPGVQPFLVDLPLDAVVVDTSNYYPLRDQRIQALDDGQVESLWVSEQIGRPVVKAWNAITSFSFAEKATAAGSAGRLAIPVAADDLDARNVGMALVDATGFDAYDAGPLSESWRQQPGSPCYCTELTLDEMPAALAAADRARSPRRRDLAMTVLYELLDDFQAEASSDLLVRVNRLLYM